MTVLRWSVERRALRRDSPMLPVIERVAGLTGLCPGGPTGEELAHRLKPLKSSRG